MKRLPIALLTLSLVTGCLPRAVAAAFVARSASEASGAFGWFRGGERIGEKLTGAGCAQLGGGGDGPVYVLVHGLGGEGPELKRTSELLSAAHPAGLLRFSWAPWDERDRLVEQLGDGLTVLGGCAPGRVIVIAHSAGGVLASLAAAKVTPPGPAPDPWLTVLTVASPLAGALAGPLHTSEQELLFFFDLGPAPHYASPPPGVRVLHLRTRAPADREMKPLLGHVPNDARVGVPGARQIDLPAALSHAGSLVYVAKRLADGSFAQWAEEAGR